MAGTLQKLTTTTPLSADLGLLAIRLWFGGAMALTHGYAKLMNLSAFSAKVGQLGFPAPQILGPLAGLSEFLGGVLLAIGLFTRPAATALLATMLAAAFKVHAHDSLAKKELALCYGAAALAIVIAGPGALSLDARIFGPRIFGRRIFGRK